MKRERIMYTEKKNDVSDSRFCSAVVWPRLFSLSVVSWVDYSVQAVLWATCLPLLVFLHFIPIRIFFFPPCVCILCLGHASAVSSGRLDTPTLTWLTRQTIFSTITNTELLHAPQPNCILCNDQFNYSITGTKEIACVVYKKKKKK